MKVRITKFHFRQFIPDHQSKFLMDSINKYFERLSNHFLFHFSTTFLVADLNQVCFQRRMERSLSSCRIRVIVMIRVGVRGEGGLKPPIGDC